MLSIFPLASPFPLPYNVLDKAFCFFEMMGWTVGTDMVYMNPLEPENKFLQYCFAVPDTDLYYWITHGPTTFHISLETMGDGETGSDSSGFDR